MDPAMIAIEAPTIRYIIRRSLRNWVHQYEDGLIPLRLWNCLARVTLSC